MGRRVWPYLFYEDGEATVEFLRRAFDFREVDRQTGAAGAEIVEELTGLPFGHRRHSCNDPEGHQWSFAQVVG